MSGNRPSRMSTTEPSSTPWPQHPLLRPNLEHARQARWLAKPVHDLLLIDDMEQARGWVASSTVDLVLYQRAGQSRHAVAAHAHDGA